MKDFFVFFGVTSFTALILLSALFFVEDYKKIHHRLEMLEKNNIHTTTRLDGQNNRLHDLEINGGR